MRLRSAFRFLFSTSVVCLAVISCDQRPLDVVPETGVGEWRTATAFKSEHFRDLDGISSSDIYGVASQSGLIHYDGTGWSELGSPNGVGLGALSVVSAGEIYAVGGSKAYRYDGSTWTNFYDGRGRGLIDIWTIDGSSVFVTFYGGGFPGHSIGGVYRFDQSLALVDSVHTGSPMTAFWGSSQSDVFAVGYHDSILHFDGTSWTSAGHDGGAVFSNVHGVGPDEVYAVGSRSSLLKYDGTRWTSIELPEEVTGIAAVWAAASDN